MSQLDRRNLPIRTGFALFVTGHALAVIGLGVAAFGFAHGSYVTLVIGLTGIGEALILGSILFLGDDGYRRLEARMSVVPPRRRADATTLEVTQRRHRLGIGLLVVHVLGYFLVWAAAIIAYTRATPDDPFPTIAGLTFCLGLVLVVVGGAELFTGNNLVVMAVVGGRLPWTALATTRPSPSSSFRWVRRAGSTGRNTMPIA